MRIDFFSSLLILMIVAMTTKWVALFGRVQEQAKYTFTSSTNSVFMDLAYAKEDEDEEIEDDLNAEEDNPALEEPNIIKSNIPQLSQTSHVSNEELRLLKELSKRREELNKAQDEIQMRENVLKATENKIEQKLNDLKSLQSQVSETMKAYNEKENDKISSLVRIYETMKPKDAAKIFDALEMPVLLEIATHMKEVKLSAIIASMQTHKATELSVELSKQKKMNWDK